MSTEIHRSLKHHGSFKGSRLSRIRYGKGKMSVVNLSKAVVMRDLLGKSSKMNSSPKCCRIGHGRVLGRGLVAATADL